MIQDGRVLLQGDAGPFGYRLGHVEEWLQENVGERAQQRGE